MLHQIHSNSLLEIAIVDIVLRLVACDIRSSMLCIPSAFHGSGFMFDEFEWLQESNTKHRQTQRCWHLPKTTR